MVYIKLKVAYPSTVRVKWPGLRALGAKAEVTGSKLCIVPRKLSLFPVLDVVLEVHHALPELFSTEAKTGKVNETKLAHRFIKLEGHTNATLTPSRCRKWVPN